MKVNNQKKVNIDNRQHKKLFCQISWWRISEFQKLSEDFIREYKDYLDWYHISCCQTLSEEFIIEFEDKVHWNCISRYQKLSNQFIRNNIDQLNIDLLLDNAGKYSTTKTQIKIIIEKKKTHTQIQIINIGIGIPPKDQDKVFNRFYRLTDSQVQKETGSGLGLAIAKKLSQEIGAQLVLLDGSPTNTTFSLLI
ncbi:ATP-binding protein [bacterium]|nr:ATP-binding protein [bacterium]